MKSRLENAKCLYMEAIQDGNAAEAIEKYAGERYTQHSTPVRDGKQGFIEFFEDFHRRNPTRQIQILRGFEDGPFVFLHVLQVLNHGEFEYVTADIFETDAQRKMVEHWDLIEEVAADSISGHTQFGGPTEVVDLDRTDANKTLVKEFLEEVMAKGAHDGLSVYLSDSELSQHSPKIGDGIEGLRTYLDALKGEGRPLIYREIHRVIGSGNFVAALSKVEFGETEFAVMDLFRVAEGRIVEHWDVMEKITPRETWVNGGKF